MRVGLLTLEGVLGPHALRVDELGFPRLDVAIQIGNELILVVRHTRPEMSDANVSLLRPPEKGGRGKRLMLFSKIAGMKPHHFIRE